MEWEAFIYILTSVIPMVISLLIILKIIKTVYDLIYVNNLQPKGIIPFFPYIFLIYYLSWFFWTIVQPEQWGFVYKNGAWTITFTSIGNVSHTMTLIFEKLFDEGLAVILTMIFVTGIMEILIYNINLYKKDRRKKSLPTLNKR